MLNKIDHIGIAVRSLEDHIPLYRDIFGLEYLGSEVVEREGVRVAFFQLGESKIELLEPLHDDSPIAKFLEKKGEGIHHVAMGTDDVMGERENAENHGLRLLSKEPLAGAHGKWISFIHPRDTKGVLFEFCQRRDDLEDLDTNEPS